MRGGENEKERGRERERERWRKGEKERDIDLMASIIKLQDAGTGCLDPAGFGDLVCAPPRNLFKVLSAN